MHYKDIPIHKLTELSSLSTELISRLPDYDRALGDLLTMSNLDVMEFFNLTVVPKSEGGISTSGELDGLVAPPSVLVGGCSETVGELVADEGYEKNKKYMWWHIASKSVNKSVVNTASGAASITRIVNKLLKFCQIYGKPETIIVLVPPANTRLYMPNDESYMVDSRIENTNHIGLRRMMHNMVSRGEVSKISKAPHAADEVLSPALISYINLNSLQTLEHFCLSNNINLIYSTWDPVTEAIIESANRNADLLELPRPFKSFISTNAVSWMGFRTKKTSVYDSCHLDIKTSDPENFEIGLKEHMGKHRQLHIGEIFAEHLKMLTNT